MLARVESKTNYLSFREAHLAFVAQFEPYSWPTLLGIEGDPRFDEMYPMPAEIREEVLVWTIEELMVPDNPALQMENIAKTTVKMVARISMAEELHGQFKPHIEIPLTPEQRQRFTLASKLYSWLFWYDDNFGNELQASLTATESMAFERSLARMKNFFTTGNLEGTPQDIADTSIGYKIRELHRAERTLVDLIAELKSFLPDTPAAAAWQDELELRLLTHLEKGNANVEDFAFDVPSYLDFRRQGSGMNVAALMPELIYGYYLPRLKHRQPGFEKLNAAFKYLAAAEERYENWGGGGNDQASETKESIDEGSNTNIVAVAFNEIFDSMLQMGLPIDEAQIYGQSQVEVGAMLALMKDEFFEIMDWLIGTDENGDSLPGYIDELKAEGLMTEDEFQAFVHVLRDWRVGIIATYHWQRRKGYLRYNHPQSPLKEFRPNAQTMQQILQELHFGSDLLVTVGQALVRLQAKFTSQPQSA